MVNKQPMIEEKYGAPSIKGITCTYDTKDIRSDIERRFELKKTFLLPPIYTYEIRPSAFHGEVAKIILDF